MALGRRTTDDGILFRSQFSRNEFYFVLAGHQHNAFSVGEGAGSTSTQNSRIQVYSIE